MVTNKILQDSRKSIEKFMGITEIEHNKTLFECGIYWLEANYGFDRTKYEYYAYAPEFWQWWTETWHKRNYEMMLQEEWISLDGTIRYYHSRNTVLQSEVEFAFRQLHRQDLMKIYPSKAILK